jgi:hypothetical protein
MQREEEVNAMVDCDLDSYEIAYLCGGPDRVALVVLVTLHQQGRIRISAGRHRVSVLHRRATEPMHAAVLDAVPDTGKVLGAVVQAVTGSPQVLALIEALKAKGLAARRRLPAGPSLTAQGRRVRRRLKAAQPAGHQIAVLGTTGIDDATLRRAFETPDPPPGRTLIPKNPYKAAPDPTTGAAAPDRTMDFYQLGLIDGHSSDGGTGY